MPAPLPFDGQAITLAGVAYTMPAINAATAKRYWARIEAMKAGVEPDPLGLVADLVHACLRRNYPEIDAEHVAECVDLDNMDALSSACFGAGAFRRWSAMQLALQQAEAGNPIAPQPMATAGTGALSTQPSPPPPAGGSPTSMP